MKIIVNIRDDISEISALEYVIGVMKLERVSKAREIKHFGWASRFKDGTIVTVREKKTAKSPDSFIVYKE